MKYLKILIDSNRTISNKIKTSFLISKDFCHPNIYEWDGRVFLSAEIWCSTMAFDRIFIFCNILGRFFCFCSINLIIVLSLAVLQKFNLKVTWYGSLTNYALEAENTQYPILLYCRNIYHSSTRVVCLLCYKLE